MMGVMDYWINGEPSGAALEGLGYAIAQYSNTSTFQPSNNPTIHQSITPLL
jgi:hypothetical protein